MLQLWLRKLVLTTSSLCEMLWNLWDTVLGAEWS